MTLGKAGCQVDKWTADSVLTEPSSSLNYNLLVKQVICVFSLLTSGALSLLGTSFIVIHVSFSLCFHILKFASQIFLDTLLCPGGSLKSVPVALCYPGASQVPN